MWKRKKWRRAALLAMTAAALLAGCGTNLSGGTLRVGVKDDVANFGLYDGESGKYSGMEIDLAERLQEELGYRNLELVTVTTADRETSLDQDRVDMVIATYSITKNREKKYDFSTPYYTDYAAILVEESSMISKLEDLKDCTVGVVENTSSARSLAVYMGQEEVIPQVDADTFSLKDFDGELRFQEYGSYGELSQALEYGDVDAIVADRSILSGYIREDRKVLPYHFSEQEYGVCTKKGSGLSEKVDEAIQKWLEDGTIDGLIEKWGN